MDTNAEYNAQYKAGQMSSDIENVQSDVTEIKENVQKLVDKLWALEVRVYVFAAIVATLTSKGTDIITALIGGR